MLTGAGTRGTFSYDAMEALERFPRPAMDAVDPRG
jgi:hypothetical protein